MVQKEWQLVKLFLVPAELKDGLIYCQRALRDCVIQHQILASKINILPRNQRSKAKKFMRELEGEMMDIGQDQGGLMRDLSLRLADFRDYVRRKMSVDISEEIANGYVTRVLQTHNDTMGQAALIPANCSARLSASELAEKYCLEAILKQEKFADDDNACFAPWLTTAPQQQQRSLLDPKKTKTAMKTYPKASGLQTTPYSAEGAVPASRSLLKPKLERTEQQTTPPEPAQRVSVTREPTRAFASVSDTEEKKPITVEAKERVETDDTEKSITAAVQAEDVKPTASAPQQQVHPRPGGIWMPGLRGRPPKGVNYVPGSKVATMPGQQRSQFHRKRHQSMLRERMPSNTAEESAPSPPADVESSEEQSAEVTFGRRPSAAVRRGRSNLLQALNKLKRPAAPAREDVEACPPRPKVGRPRKIKPVEEIQFPKRPSSGSSGSSPNSRSSTPTLSLGGRHAASDDSSDRRCDVPLHSPPNGELVVPPPNDIWELGMTALLKYFELCTPEEAKARRERRQERKRRSCYSTERKDFHYGRLDYYEQQQQMQAASRRSKRPNHRPILYSPPVAAVKKRKSAIVAIPSSANAAVSRHRLPVRCVSLDSRDIFAAMANQSCFVCNKTGSTDELSACTNCCNIYHLSCHRIEEDDDDIQLSRQRDNLCPVCLTTDDGDK